METQWHIFKWPLMTDNVVHIINKYMQSVFLTELCVPVSSVLLWRWNFQMTPFLQKTLGLFQECWTSNGTGLHRILEFNNNNNAYFIKVFLMVLSSRLLVLLQDDAVSSIWIEEKPYTPRPTFCTSLHTHWYNLLSFCNFSERPPFLQLDLLYCRNQNRTVDWERLEDNTHWNVSRILFHRTLLNL